jgi:hypothetical protein
MSWLAFGVAVRRVAGPYRHEADRLCQTGTVTGPCVIGDKG